MDNFMDKLAQKLNAQEIIKANSAAEAMEIKKLEAQVEEYQNIMQEMRKVNLKNAQLVDAMEEIMDASVSTLNSFSHKEDNVAELSKTLEPMLNQLQSTLEEAVKKSDEYVHTECVKVYRNVQAVVVEGFKEQNEKTSEKEEQLIKNTKGTKVIMILTLLLTLANCAVSICNILGVF